MKERLQKILANAGICSRRKAEEYIRQGKVTVDGLVVTELGTKVDPRHQTILFNNQSLSADTKKIYLLLNKPKGYVTTLSDPQGRPIVSSLLKGIPQRLFPVGRLDLDTEGALLMTNDGDLADKVIHPRYEINKTYLAIIQGKISKAKILALENGITLNGQKTWPAKITVRDSSPESSKIQIIIHEGKKRQVRRMFEAVGHPVIHLKRLAYGNLHLGTLSSGKYRYLTNNDIEKIFFEKKSLYKK